MGTKEYHREYYRNNKEKWKPKNEMEVQRRKEYARSLWPSYREVGLQKRREWTKIILLRTLLGRLGKELSKRGWSLI